jgi:hypothetical protein
MLTLITDNRTSLERLLQQKNNQLLSILAEGKTSYGERKGLYADIIHICKAITAALLKKK